MSVSWMLGTVSLFATTIGALLIFLHLLGAPRIAEDRFSPDERQAADKHRKRSLVGVGLLAAWLLVQAVAVLLL